VKVGPPLSASAPSSGFIGVISEPMRLLFTPFVMPVRPVLIPIRLYELVLATIPLISSRTVVMLLKLPATIVLCSVTVPSPRANPPPRPIPLLSISAVLLVIVTLLSVASPINTCTPPPSPLVALPEIVLFVIMREPWEEIPPPEPIAMLLEMVEFVIVSVPVLCRPPPLFVAV